MANAKLGTKAVGSIVKLKVGGTAKEFIVVHQGKPGSMYDESCNGTWLLMKDCYEMRQWHSSDVNKYETSDVNTYLNGPFFNLFDSNIQGIIKQVKIPYRKGDGTNQSGANGLSCKVFLLGGYEVGWTTSDSRYFPVDGAKLDYFGASAGGNSKRIANYGGSATSWGLRSPSTYSRDSYMWFVFSDGSYSTAGPSASVGIRPALILPSTTLVDDSGNVVTVDLTAHKALVNGTVYEVKGGKCLVNGTVYSIKKGRTLIDGTGYDITFAPDVSLTWYFNESIDATGYPGITDVAIKFSSNGAIFDTIRFGYTMNANALAYLNGTTVTAAYYYQSWRNQGYRTVTFEEPPTGKLLEFLQKNATKQ